MSNNKESDSNKWKNFLLKSGLPLEYEVMRYLEDKKCVSGEENSYLRKNEANLNTEFSYDIDTSFIEDGNFFNLMIECKYRHPSVKWVFTPVNSIIEYWAKNDGFLHSLDMFNMWKFSPDSLQRKLGPFCGKGIELLPDGNNEKSITQAVCQLSYAMADKVIDSLEHQFNKLLGKEEYIFYNIPVIVTTADLYRLKSDVTIKEIQNAKNIEDVSVREECIVLSRKIGANLKSYNTAVFNKYLAKLDIKDINNKLRDPRLDFASLVLNIAEHSCPEAVVVLQFTDDNKAFNKLFEYIYEVISLTKIT